MALVNIVSEIKEIEAELAILGRIKYKLSSQMRHFKEMHRLRMIRSRVKKFMREAIALTSYDVKSIDNFTLTKELEIIQEILSFLKNQGLLLKDFI